LYAYQKQLHAGDDDDDDNESQNVSHDDDAADEDKSRQTYFVYTVFRKEWDNADDEAEIESIEPQAMGDDHHRLKQANDAARSIALTLAGDADGSIEWTQNEGMFTWTYRTNTRSTQAWVERTVRLRQSSGPDADTSCNLFKRTVYVVKQEISVLDDGSAASGYLAKSENHVMPIEGDGTTTTTAKPVWIVTSATDIGPVHATLDHANATAATHVLETLILTRPPAATRNLDVLDVWKAGQRAAMMERRKQLEEMGEAFFWTAEAREGESGGRGAGGRDGVEGAGGGGGPGRGAAGLSRVVRVWVEGREFVGPRN